MNGYLDKYKNLIINNEIYILLPKCLLSYKKFGFIREEGKETDIQLFKIETYDGFKYNHYMINLYNY